jgi:hypothetical protein
MRTSRKFEELDQAARRVRELQEQLERTHWSCTEWRARLRAELEAARHEYARLDFFWNDHAMRRTTSPPRLTLAKVNQLNADENS